MCWYVAGLGTLGWFLYSLYDGISLKYVIKGFKGKLEQKVKKKKKITAIDYIS